MNTKFDIRSFRAGSRMLATLDNPVCRRRLQHYQASRRRRGPLQRHDGKN